MDARPPAAEPHHPGSLGDLRGWLAHLEGELRDLLRERRAAVAKSIARRQEAEEAIRQVDEGWSAEWDAERRSHQETFARERDRIEEEAARNIARVGRGYESARKQARAELADQTAELDEQERTRKQEALTQLQAKYAPLYDRCSASSGALEGLRARTQDQEEKIRAFAAGLRIRLEDPSSLQGTVEPVPRERVAETVERSLAENEKLLDSLRKEMWVRFTRSTPLIWTGIVALAVHAAALLAVRLAWPDAFLKACVLLPVTFLGSLLVVFETRRASRRQARDAIRTLQTRWKSATTLLRSHEAGVAGDAERIGEKLFEEETRQASRIKEEIDRMKEDARDSTRTWVESLAWRRDRLVERIQQKRDRQLSEAQAELERTTSAARFDSETRLRRRQGSEKVAEAAASEKEELSRLEAAWKRAIEDCRERGEAARRRCTEQHPPWSDPRWRDSRLPDAFPASVPVGELRLDPLALAVEGEEAGPIPFPRGDSLGFPLALSFPGPGSLFIQADPAGRGSALQVLLNTLLRIVCSFPAGKAKFLLLDPVGLGQSFSALMHLADYDESLVGGRIWTEPVHIERKLAELTEHLEKVIQKYLRNRYASIDEYNREVGPLAEAYRFLVIADFPTGFNDLAVERLSGILASGARCGVHTLILHDRKQRLPAALDLPTLRRSAIVFEGEGDGFALASDGISRGSVSTERPPDSAILTSLLHAVGRQCADAGRVELPFERAAPKEDQVWSLTSENGIRVPLGMSGADRLQLLDLGRGTTQHALVAGKTGSGKSTLFHVMITNAALWYGPRELEMYLIDYKKGVEFKTFAVNGLPHARVVAIESDREFGLSVLRRIDRELAHRAELFRKAGVQDFAGYRRNGTGAHLPRTLLLIDEFQEFFVEEDATAQEAALLLDRIVRQGRAFGVHVVLGSQTLGGSYTLARATLGQMAVRIALQCNEADSYLILSDDNAAARLLSRPGEAIYNDMSGLIEGNNPFQVVWLADAVEDRLLGSLCERAKREGWQPGEAATIFEGNTPADIRQNALLNRRLARPFHREDEGGLAVWLGEPNAIKGPTEVRFKNRVGGNLLIVGQQRDSALAVITSSVVGLAAAHPPGEIRLVVLDGSPPELGHAQRLAELARAIPHGLELVEYSRVPDVMEELDAEIAGRADGSRSASAPVFLIINDIQRFRKLRQGDEFDVTTAEGEKPPPDRFFANILSEGPPQRVHTIVWCDSLANLNRTFHRKTLREFEMRVLFQMSAADSSELTDTPLASKLGLHRGVLFLEEEGTVETFRPYALPGSDWLEEVRRALNPPEGR